MECTCIQDSVCTCGISSVKELNDDDSIQIMHCQDQLVNYSHGHKRGREGGEERERTINTFSEALIL